MPTFKLKLNGETTRFFPKYGELASGATVEADEQPADGVTWSWSKGGNAKAAIAEPVTPDTAEGARVVIDEKPAKASKS